MTEKRFTYLDALKSHYIGSFFCNGVPLTNKEVVNLLNKLNDKSEFLEIENEALEDAAIKYAELCHKSLKENEQLKKEVLRLNHELKGYVNDEDWAVIVQYNALLKKNDKIKKENEQLKQQIKDLRLGILDSIYKAYEIKCNCSPCVVEECVKKVIE